MGAGTGREKAPRDNRIIEKVWFFHERTLEKVWFFLE